MFLEFPKPAGDYVTVHVDVHGQGSDDSENEYSVFGYTRGDAATQVGAVTSGGGRGCGIGRGGRGGRGCGISRGGSLGRRGKTLVVSHF